MRHLLTAAMGALLLAACSTPEQKAVKMQAEVEQMMRIYGPACSRLGYPDQSDQWRNCVMQLSAKEDAQRYGYPNYHVGFGRRHWSLGGVWGPYW